MERQRRGQAGQAGRQRQEAARRHQEEKGRQRREAAGRKGREEAWQPGSRGGRRKEDEREARSSPIPPSSLGGVEAVNQGREGAQGTG